MSAIQYPPVISIMRCTHSRGICISKRSPAEKSLILSHIRRYPAYSLKHIDFHCMPHAWHFIPIFQLNFRLSVSLYAYLFLRYHKILIDPEMRDFPAFFRQIMLKFGPSTIHLMHTLCISIKHYSPKRNAYIGGILYTI